MKQIYGRDVIRLIKEAELEDLLVSFGNNNVLEFTNDEEYHTFVYCFEQDSGRVFPYPDNWKEIVERIEEIKEDDTKYLELYGLIDELCLYNDTKPFKSVEKIPVKVIKIANRYDM